MSGNKALGKALFSRVSRTEINQHTIFGLTCPQPREGGAKLSAGMGIWWKNKPQKPAIPAEINLPILGFLCTQRVVKLWKRHLREGEVFKNHDVVYWAWE